MAKQGVTCPACRNSARRMYRRWDEMLTHGTAWGWLGLALLGVGVMTGPWGYLAVAAGLVALVVAARRSPNKYCCDTCDHAFFWPGLEPGRSAPTRAHAAPGR